jgi:hypothetical protein
MKNLLIAFAIIATLANCSESEDVEKMMSQPEMIDFTFQVEAQSSACVNGYLTVAIMGKTVAENKVIDTVYFKCKQTDKITVQVPVDSWVYLQFYSDPTVKYMTITKDGKTFSNGDGVMFEVSK